MSKSLTEKQKALFRDTFNYHFEELLKRESMKPFFVSFCLSQMSWLRQFIAYDSSADISFCKNEIKMFERILDNGVFDPDLDPFGDKEVSDE